MNYSNMFTMIILFSIGGIICYVLYYFSIGREELHNKKRPKKWAQSKRKTSR